MVKPINTENSVRLLLATSCNNPHAHFPLSNESWLRPTTVNMTVVIIAWENHIRQNIKNNFKKKCTSFESLLALNKNFNATVVIQCIIHSKLHTLVAFTQSVLRSDSEMLIPSFSFISNFHTLLLFKIYIIKEKMFLTIVLK